MSEVDAAAEVKECRLLQLLASTVDGEGMLLLAYSGGVDSGYLAWAAHRVLGGRALAVIADSPSLPRRELAAALRFAEDFGIACRVISTNELGSAAYARNDALRCFHCKDELFRVMQHVARESCGENARIAYGRNVDDRGDFRPGQRAAASHGVLSPLAEAGLTKVEIRALAKRAGLPLWSKPASACLASRVEFQRNVSTEVLAQIENAEDALHDLGFHQVRVRHHGEIARVEIEHGELPGALSVEMLETIGRRVKMAGFRYVALDMEGYRSGSMNEMIPIQIRTEHGG